MAEITWIKLRTNMFDDEKIRLLERLPDGDMVIVVWIKLLAQAGKVNCGGYIMIAENIPMSLDEMSVIFNKTSQQINYALTALQRYGMIEIDEESTIFISNWEKHQNIDGMEKIRIQNAERQKRHRQRKKIGNDQPLLEMSNSNVTHNVTVTQCNALDIELDIDKEKEIKEVFETKVSSVNKLIGEQFEEWWNLYARKTQKPKALTAFKKVVKQYTYEQLKKDTEIYIGNYTGDPKYKPYPTTFLNSYNPDDERFESNQQSNYSTNQHQGASSYVVQDKDLYGDVE